MQGGDEPDIQQEEVQVQASQVIVCFIFACH